MLASAIPRKTEHAKLVLQGRDFPGTRAQRLFLIMVDGRKPLRELAGPASHLGIDEAALQQLLDAGLIEWVPRTTQRSAPAADTAAPTAPPTPAQPSPARSPRTMAAAKMYVLDLATLMLQGQDREVRDAAREVTDAEQMKDWLNATAERIADRAGTERAAAFVARVIEVLPDDVAALFVEGVDAVAG